MIYEDDIIKALIFRFGDMYEQEIEHTLSSSDGDFSELGRAGRFEVDAEGYNWIESEEEAERIAIEIVKLDDLDKNENDIKFDGWRKILTHGIYDEILNNGVIIFKELIQDA